MFQQKKQNGEAQAITAGDMRILEVANLRTEVQKLGRQQRAHQRQIESIEARRMFLQSHANVLEHDLEAMQKLAPHGTDTRADLFRGLCNRPLGRRRRRRQSGRTSGRRLRTAVVRAREQFGERGFGPHNVSYPRPLSPQVTVAGIAWDAALRWNRHVQDDPLVEFAAGSTHKALQAQILYSRMLDGQLSQISQPFERAARDLPATIAEHQVELGSTQQEVIELRSLERAGWPKQDELNEKQARLAGLIGELEQEV